MFKRISLTLLIISLSLITFAVSVHAQQPISFDSLSVDLWPEYDQPNVLVIYKATLSPEVSLPAEVTLRIPDASGNPFVVAVGPDTASVADVAYETQLNGDWIDVSFIATTPAIQFEYYDPNLIKDGTSRSFQYSWLEDIPVKSMVISLQHPVGSSNYVVAPDSGEVTQGSDGFTYTVVTKDEVAAGDEVSLSASYQKASDTLSVTGMQVEPSAPLPGPISAINLRQVLPWLLLALAIVLIAGGIFWYWRSSRGASASTARRHRKPTTSAEKGASSDGIYCHQCGKKAEAGDRYCRSCGVRLRIE